MLPPYSSDIVLSTKPIRDAAVFHAVARRRELRRPTRLILRDVFGGHITIGGGQLHRCRADDEWKTRGGNVPKKYAAAGLVPGINPTQNGHT
jgi:hypothetical protein